MVQGKKKEVRRKKIDNKKSNIFFGLWTEKDYIYTNGLE